MIYTDKDHNKKVIRSADTVEGEDVWSYSPDCPACLRGIAHSNKEHNEKIYRATRPADELPEYE